MKKRLIDIYPFESREVKVIGDGENLRVAPEILEYIKEKWALKATKGWKSSWIPIISKICYYTDFDGTNNKNLVDISAGIMTYAQTYALLQAMKEGKDFAPEVLNNLSIGVIPVTSDGYVVISRRSNDLDHAPGIWNFEGGYMTSLLIDREYCDEEKYAFDPRLFDLNFQINARIHKQGFKWLREEDIKLAQRPSALVLGYTHSQEMEIGWVARLKKTKDEMQQHIGEHQITGGGREHNLTDFIAVEDLPKLIENQPEIWNYDPISFSSNSPLEKPFLDCNIGELIGGAYEEITGERFPEKVVRKLRLSGIEVKLREVSDPNLEENGVKYSGVTYNFETIVS